MVLFIGDWSKGDGSLTIMPKGGYTDPRGGKLYDPPLGW